VPRCQDEIHLRSIKLTDVMPQIAIIRFLQLLLLLTLLNSYWR
jgi:hypothetical protein